MPKALPNQDIKYQPEVKEYSFSTKKPKILSNTFFTLVFSVVGMFLLFLVFLGILNYFNIISLSTYFPSTTNSLPKVNTQDYLKYDKQSNTWTLSGALDGYDDTNLQVRYKDKIIFLLYDQNSLFYVQSANTKVSANLADFKTPKSINKHINASFKINKDGNIIQEITLFQ